MKHSVNRVVLILAFLLCAVHAAASGSKETDVPECTEGLSSGAVTAISLREKNIRYTQVIKTEYFDIIYPEQSERTALLLASRIDALYEKAAAEFETDPWMTHFPVIISPSTQVFNAYYTGSPYNHIVLLDTPNTSVTLAVEAETIVNTFYHELIHAVTANIHKNSIWNRPNLFGDFYSLPFLLNSKLFFIEGATVSRESSEGEGRVNSGEAMSIVIQSKLEGKFPAWKDIAGPRDIYPSQTASYIFGGAFNAWLQNEYGMSRYADFWKECSGIDITGFTGNFKDAYGMSLNEAWDLFEQSVPLPETNDEGLHTVLDDDSRFSSLAYRPGSRNGIVYVKNGCSVRYLDFTDAEEPEDHELFSCYGAPVQLSFSNDGRYLAVSGYMTGTTEAYSVRFFDMDEEEFTGAEIPYSRNAVITEDDGGKQYVFCIESAASYEFASLYLLDDVLSSAETVPVPVSRTELSVFDELYSTAPVTGGAAVLRKSDGIWFVTVAHVDGSSESWQFPDNAVPAGLSSETCIDGTTRLYTAITSRSMNAGSETEPGALARLGVITIDGDDATLSYQKAAFSGGVHGAVISQRGTVYGISALYESDSLCCFHISDTAMTDAICLSEGDPKQGGALSESYTVRFEPEKYKPVSYMKRGTIFPLAGIIMSPFAPATVNPIGFSWWTETPDEKLNLALSFGAPLSGYNMEINATLYGQQTNLSGGTFLWDVDGTLQFDKNNYAQMFLGRAVAAEQLTLSNPGNMLTVLNGLVLADSAFYPGVSALYRLSDTVSIQYAHQKKKGMNPLAVEGFSFGAHFLYEYDVLSSYTRATKTGKQIYDEKTYACPGLSAGINLARLLPLPYMPKQTVNWPVSISASLWNDPGTFVKAGASVVLYSAEIQKGIPVIPFFCNRFTVDAGWSFRNGAPEGYQFTSSWLIFETEEMLKNFNSLHTTNVLTAGLNFEIAPDVGNMYNVHINAGVNGMYYLRNDNSDKLYEVSVLGLIKF